MYTFLSEPWLPVCFAVLQRLLQQVSTSAGITAPGRCSAVSALHHILALQGHSPAVKQELLAVNGLGTLVQIMGCSTLPLQCRAAAAGCVCHFLAPAQQGMRPGSSSSSSAQAALQGKGRGWLLLIRTRCCLGALAPKLDMCQLLPADLVCAPCPCPYCAVLLVLLPRRPRQFAAANGGDAVCAKDSTRHSISSRSSSEPARYLRLPQ
jgi:hypothetical protein